MNSMVDLSIFFVGLPEGNLKSPAVAIPIQVTCDLQYKVKPQSPPKL